MNPVKNVTITITHGHVEVHPARVTVFKKAQEEVSWYSPQGEASINFERSPFPSDHLLCPLRGRVTSGPAEAEPGEYKYSIIVRIEGDRREYVIDPTVIVED